MGTIQNTAALYLRKSSLDDRSGDNRRISDQRHDLERLAERHGLQIVAESEEKVGTSASHIKNHARPRRRSPTRWPIYSAGWPTSNGGSR
ncbi:MAG: recombinase family protein, partial [Acidimicrobiales bacterium]|nr:recombinase family protein [Acidimicrobiales bacterium]